MRCSRERPPETLLRETTSRNSAHPFAEQGLQHITRVPWSNRLLQEAATYRRCSMEQSSRSGSHWTGTRQRPPNRSLDTLVAAMEPWRGPGPGSEAPWIRSWPPWSQFSRRPGYTQGRHGALEGAGARVQDVRPKDSWPQMELWSALIRGGNKGCVNGVYSVYLDARAEVYYSPSTTIQPHVFKSVQISISASKSHRKFQLPK